MPTSKSFRTLVTSLWSKPRSSRAFAPSFFLNAQPGINAGEGLLLVKCSCAVRLVSHQRSTTSVVMLVL
ncbi:hypothetical protein V5799_014396 [Amblyomma americanum]|uniref:Uncharacterized protein n=1 Tax=Amblyomma americanum TaxID=6943 RepID=A0AAQ4E364_AMBAM